MVIRPATPSDMRFIITEGLSFMKHHPLSFNKDLDLKELIKFADNIMHNHVLLIAEDNGVQVGMIAGILAPNVFNSKYIGLTELVWWVKEEFRNSSAAMKLFNAFEKKAKEMDADYISMITTVYTPTLEKLYKKKNYKPTETTYVKEL